MHNALFPQPGGIGNYIYHLGRELVAAKYEVIIITERSKFYPKKKQTVNGFTVLTYRPTKFGFLNLMFPKIISNKNSSILETLNLDSHDTIVVRNLFIASYLHKKCEFIYFPPNPIRIIAQQWVKNVQKRKDFTSRLLVIMYKILAKKWHSLETAVLDASTKNLVISNNTKNNYKELFPQKRFSVLYPGCDVSLKNAIPEDDICDILSKRNRSESALLYVGRLDQEKNITEFTRWFVATKLNMHLHIVGTGKDVTRIRELVKLDERVVLHGYQSFTLNYYYQNTDVLILPSKVEGFGQVILESLMNGTPIIGFETSKELETSTAILELSELTQGIGKLNTDFDNLKECEFETLVNKLKLLDRSEIKSRALECFSWRRCMNEFLRNIRD